MKKSWLSVISRVVIRRHGNFVKTVIANMIDSCIVFLEKIVLLYENQKMVTKNNLRQRIINRIKNLSEDKLDSVENYILNIENDINAKSEILSFSGIFKDLDKDIMNDLTINLPKRRIQGTSRIY